MSLGMMKKCGQYSRRPSSKIAPRIGNASVIRPLLLDTGPLGKIAHPRPNPEVLAWLVRMLRGRVEVIIPEITDFELRRNLLLEGLVNPLASTEYLEANLPVVVIQTIGFKGAEFAKSSNHYRTTLRAPDRPVRRGILPRLRRIQAGAE